MRNVLMISQVFPPVNKPGSARPFFFAKHLCEFGYFPSVIAATPSLGGPRDEGLLAELDGRARIRNIDELGLRNLLKWQRNGTQVTTANNGRKAAPSGPKKKSRNRFVQRAKCAWSGGCWSLPALAAGMRELRDPGFDLIWATGDPWNSLMAGFWLSKITGKPLVADLRDPWTYGVLWSPRNATEEKWNRDWERRILTYARRTIFTSPLTTAIMAGKYDEVTTRRFVTITNGFRDEQAEISRPSAKTQCVFRFVGGFGKNKRPAPFFEAIRLAKQADAEFAQDVRFELIGRIDAYLEELEAAALGDSVKWLGHVSHTESLAYMRGADVLVLLQTESGEGGDCISGKAFEYLRAGRPILAITPPDTGDAWLIQSTHSGVVTGVDHPAAIAQKMTDLWRQWQEFGHLAPPQAVGVEQYSRRNTSARLAAVFDQVLAGN